MFKVEFTGFKTKKQAESFVEWYEGSGEQSAGDWFTARMDDSELDVDFMPVDCAKTYPLVWNDDVLKCYLKDD